MNFFPYNGVEMVIERKDKKGGAKFMRTDFVRINFALLKRITENAFYIFHRKTSSDSGCLIEYEYMAIVLYYSFKYNYANHCL
ncbi:MAG: hypothetical protein AUJ36_00205 [Parcubacteria group bacterium CG1_02_41_26]|nr:MAG: hypothetical protein AUJ36_00205 [Parcubacteria group bacterium CG1_02_41_26]